MDSNILKEYHVDIPEHVPTSIKEIDRLIEEMKIQNVKMTKKIKERKMYLENNIYGELPKVNKITEVHSELLLLTRKKYRELLLCYKFIGISVNQTSSDSFRIYFDVSMNGIYPLDSIHIDIKEPKEKGDHYTIVDNNLPFPLSKKITFLCTHDLKQFSLYVYDCIWGFLNRYNQYQFVKRHYPDTVAESDGGMLNVKLEFKMFPEHTCDDNGTTSGQVISNIASDKDSNKKTQLPHGGAGDGGDDGEADVSHSWPIRVKHPTNDDDDDDEEVIMDEEIQKDAINEYSAKDVYHCELSLEYNEYIFSLPPRVKLTYREGTKNKFSTERHSSIVKYIRENPINEFFDNYIPKNQIILKDE